MTDASYELRGWFSNGMAGKKFELCKVSEAQTSNLVQKVIDEMEENIYIYQQNKESYILGVLREFDEIVPFFYPQYRGREDIQCIIRCEGVWCLIEENRYHGGAFYAKRYAEECINNLHLLFESLDVKCLDSELDIMMLQKNAGIDIYRRREIPKTNRLTACKKQLDEIWQKKRDQIQDSQESPGNIPKELDTDEAKALLKKVIELELCVSDGNLYQWKGTPSLLGYFVDIVSDYLNVRPSNGRLPWKLFKTAFQCSDTDIATAKQAVNDYKNKSQSEPEGFLYIKNICK